MHNGYVNSINIADLKCHYIYTKPKERYFTSVQYDKLQTQ